MGLRTPLYQQHLDAGAKIVDFSGWDMPIQYQSLIEEHHAVRQHAGVFDVSHMTVVDVKGPQAKAWLQILLANDVEKLNETGRALYSAMLNDNGGVVDDLIVYRMQEGYRLVVNCGTREKDLSWMQARSRGFDVQITERPELAILAVHGPESIDRVCQLLSPDIAAQVKTLGNFRALEAGDWFIARTGYTGERGLEVILPEQDAPGLWQSLLEIGVKPIGLGARDTLRLEAGMNLYGHDMDETVSPLAANMEQTIAWEPETRQFIGRAAVEQHKREQATGGLPILTGLVLEERGVLREGLRIVCELNGETREGVITSGTFSPTLKHSIALARIPAGCQNCQVDLRGKLIPVRIVKPNFVRFGKKVFE
ncbi:MAG: glycine cleavage system aminomethyltransferase GcvT [Pseudomonadales bacterium]|nr:glycine cleavage system aminomethyltransferase GcvT [Pseudomonadales bacterium]MCP5345013.1 glycine cleavage system aminomethyltransferase GcvT [Pseudomonadales bacterium]MCP5357898.1 glycine cleavage system aminomethyltransferase GcvT [Pseudomonadales bacterium]